MAHEFNNRGDVHIVGTIQGNLNTTNYTNVIPNAEPDTISFNVRSPDINFVGRSTELRRLEEAMQSSRNLSAKKPQVIVVSGLGGVGKTQLIAKYIEINKRTYKNVIWINAERSDLIIDSFKRLAKDILNISITNEDGREKEIASVIEQMFSKLNKSRTLFIYDNVNDIESIKFVLTIEPLKDKPHVVITSRIQEWGHEIDVIQLKVWAFNDALDYISTTLNDPEDSHEEKKILLEKLQHFPLALRQATAHINHQRKVRNFRIDDYIDKFDTQEMLDSKFFQENSICNLYEKTTFTTWNVTIDEIERDCESGRLAARILKIIAYFEPENIHRDIFIHLTCEPKNRFFEFLQSKLQWLKLVNVEKVDFEENIIAAVRLLVNYSMVDSQDRQKVLSIHRLVQQVIKLKLQKTDQEKNVLGDALILFSKLVEHIKFRDNYFHAISIFDSAIKFNDLMVEFSKLPIEILSCLKISGKPIQAIEFGEKIERTFINILRELRPNTLVTDTLTAKSYIKLGMYPKALQTFEEIFDKQKNIIGENHLDTIHTQSNIARLYIKLGVYSRGLQIYQNIFEKQKNILGENHSHTVRSKSNIADSYIKLGMFSRAQKMYEEVFERHINILGPNHQDTLETRSKIADLCIKLGMYLEALQIYEEVWEKQKFTLGEDHPDTLITKLRIAFSYSKLGLYTESILALQRVMEKETILGQEHLLHTLITRSGELLYQHIIGMQDEVLRRSNKDVFRKENEITTLVNQTLQQLLDNSMIFQNVVKKPQQNTNAAIIVSRES